MTSTSENHETDMSLDELLNEHFAGKVVRKDLTKKIAPMVGLPVYVLEYLLGKYCASNDEQEIQDGLEVVKQILSEHFVRPHEAEEVKSRIRDRGNYTIIDKVTVSLNEKRDVYEAKLSNLGVHAEVSASFVKKFEELLTGGIWSTLTMKCSSEEGQQGSPFIVNHLKPIEWPNIDMEDLFAGRRHFTEKQWIDVLLRSCGYEPAQFEERVKWHLLSRLIPLIETNFNICELGTRGTGKTHVYSESSPHSVVIPGHLATSATLFYDLAKRQVGLAGTRDCLVLDDITSISMDETCVQIMKDYMASGSFSVGGESIIADASMVFLGNINQPVDTLVKTSHLLAPFPETMNDSAFFDRFHGYIPGWEIPKMRPEFFTNQFGFVLDYFAEWMHEMRKCSFSDAINKYFKLGRGLNQRDTTAVKRTVSGLLKLLYPNGEYGKDAVRRCLEYALEVRCRVKEQLKEIGDLEFHDVQFSYIDAETSKEEYISMP